MSGDQELLSSARKQRRAAPECSGKIGYLTWGAANNALKHHMKKPKRGLGKLAPYRCRHCPSWHLGHGNHQK